MASGSLQEQSEGKMVEYVVGNEPCTFLAICDELSGCKSAQALWIKLEDIALSLQVPADVICSITPGLVSKTKTHYAMLYEILVAWRGKEVMNAKLTTLICVLEQRDLHDCADVLRKRFCIATQRNASSIAIKNYKVHFQGSVVTLHEVLNGLPSESIQNFAKTFLNGSDQPDLAINDSVPPSLKYYVPRRLTTRSILDPSLFARPIKDVFVMRHIELHELSTIAKDQGADISRFHLQTVGVRFILLEYEQHFDRICKVSKAPVHLIDHNAGQFTWVKSHGNISALHLHLHDVQNEMNEDAFFHSSFETPIPICISDTPGMGKTLLLASIAHQVMTKIPGRLIRFIVLREFIQNIPSKTEATNKTFLIDIVAKQASESEFGKEVVKQLLQSENQVVQLMFDGFDEVLESQIEKAKLVLKTISQWKSTKLYVSTRPHMRDELENTLGVIGYNIIPFGEEEQINFLVKYWQQQPMITDEARLLEFARNCLEKLKEKMNDFEREIAGIPLQCMLLAKVYKDDAINYANPETRVAAKDFGMFIPITSIFEMYKKLMEMRFAKIPTNIGIWKLLWTRSPKNQEKFLTKAHMYSALQLIFPEHAEKFKSLLVGGNAAKVRELCALGILEKKYTDATTPRFVHRTFAEYFLGLFIARMLVGHSDFGYKILERYTFRDFLFNTVFSTTLVTGHLLNKLGVGRCEVTQSAFHYPVVCYFINSHLNYSESQTIRKKAWTKDSNKLYDVVTACATSDYPALFHQVFESKAHKKLLQENFTRLSQVVLLSAKYSSTELFKIISQHATQNPKYITPFIPSTSPTFSVTSLHIAVNRGHFNITKHLLDSIRSSEMEEIKFVIHCCVAGSSKDTKLTLSQKSDIIRLLVMKNQNWINETLPDGTTPLLTPNVHVNLIKCLLTCGADFRANNSANENLLHICAKQGNHDGLQYLLELETITVTEVTAKNKDDLTPFMVGLKFGKGLTLAIINLMEQKGIVVTVHIACDGARYLLWNRNILDSEWNQHFVEVMDYLVEKQSAVISGREKNAWKLTSVQINLQNIVKKIHSNDRLLTELTKRKILKEGENEAYLDHSEKLVLMLKESSRQNSFELLCVSLVACGQNQPFLLLKNCRQLDNQEIAFVTPPIGLVEFLDSKNYKVVVLKSFNLEMSIVRIRNTIDSNAPIISHMDVDETVPSSSFSIFLCKTAIRKVVDHFNTLQTKTVCLCNNTLDDLEEFELLNDEISWNDLSAEFQQELRLQMCIEVDLKDNPVSKVENNTHSKNMLTDVLYNFSCLKNELLVAFIQGHQPKLSNCMLSESIRVSEYLTNDIFNHFFPDKLAFQGISSDRLKAFAKRGQRIGRIDENIENLDYLTIENVEHFDQVSNAYNFNMHLIVYEENKFRLVKSEGSAKWLRKITKGNNPCKSVSSCDCNYLIDNINVHLVFEFPVTSETNIKFICSTQIRNVFPGGREILLLQELFDVEEIFKPLLPRNSIMADGKSASLYEVSEDSMMQPNDSLIDIVQRWAQHLTNKDEERRKLRQLAVNSLFSDSSSKIKSDGEVKTINESPYEQLFPCTIVPDTLAWYLIAELVLGSDTLEFIDLTDLRSKCFHDCIKSFTVDVNYSQYSVYSKFNWNTTKLTLDAQIESFVFQNKNFFHFLEFLLKHNYVNAIKTLFQQNVSQNDLKRWVYACVQSNHFNLLQIILSLDVPPSMFKSKELVLLAIKFANIPIIQLIVEKYVQQTGNKLKDIRLKFVHQNNVGATVMSISILNFAALRGNYSVMHYLLNNFETKPLLINPDAKNLLYFCVVDTYDMFQDQIYERQQIIDLLVFVEPRLLEEKCLALFAPNIHIDLIFHLLKHNVNVFGTDEFSKNILHICPDYLNEHEYDKLVRHLHARGDSNIFHSRDDEECTPLHHAVKCLELLDSTLEIFSSAKIDFNSVDGYGYPVLFYAIRGNRSVGFLEDLIRRGADIHKQNEYNQTFVHEAACRGSLSVLKYFISLGFDVNATDYFNNTPLHRAVEYSLKHEIVEVLVQNGANVNAINGWKETPLSIAIEKNISGIVEARTVELLKAAGAQ